VPYDPFRLWNVIRTVHWRDERWLPPMAMPKAARSTEHHSYWPFDVAVSAASPRKRPHPDGVQPSHEGDAGMFARVRYVNASARLLTSLR